MKLTNKRRQAVYDAVFDRLLDLRVQVMREMKKGAGQWEVDAMLFDAQMQAAKAAIEAAETGKHTRTWRQTHDTNEQQP